MKVYLIRMEVNFKKKWLKCKLSLNLYKALIYAHANQSERAKISLNEYKAYASDNN